MSPQYFFMILGHMIFAHDVVVLGHDIMVLDFLVLGIHRSYSWPWSFYILSTNPTI